MSTDVRIKRGLRANLPGSANGGEILVCTDSREMFFGQGGGQGLLNLSKPDPKIVSGAWASTINIDGTDLDYVRITLAGSTTINMLPAGRDGQKLVVELTQDGVGNRSVTLGTGFRWGSDLTAYTPSTSANKTDLLGLIYNTATTSWRVVSIARGY